MCYVRGGSMQLCCSTLAGPSLLFVSSKLHACCSAPCSCPLPSTCCAGTLSFTAEHPGEPECRVTILSQWLNHVFTKSFCFHTQLVLSPEWAASLWQARNLQMLLVTLVLMPWSARCVISSCMGHSKCSVTSGKGKMHIRPEVLKVQKKMNQSFVGSGYKKN